MMSKIIFLDVDGVLNCWSTTRVLPGNYLFVDTRKVLRLRDIVERTGAQIVLSSTWRCTESVSDKMAYSRLVEEFKRLRCPLWIDCTPIIPVVNREKEIQAWLSQHPEVTDYVILDDYWQELMEEIEHLVICDEATGLTKKEAERAVAMLNNEKYVVEDEDDE
jgi:hypothetical protein